MRFRSLMLPVALACAVVPLSAMRADDNHEEDKKPYVVGSLVKEPIELRDIDGNLHKLQDLRGKTVVLDFWSYKCPYNRAYEQRFSKLSKEYAEKGIAFLAIDSCFPDWDDSAEDPYAGIRKFLKDEKVPYPILIDKGNAVADMFAAKTTPHIFVIDAKGYLRYEGAIDDDTKGERPADEVTHYLADALDELLAGKEVTTKNSKPVGCSIKRVKAER
jgi:thiol-disulfide isomerase/thioredoxin